MLFVAARYDQVADHTTSRVSEPMRELCSDLTEVTVDAGHWLALERPAEVNRLVLEWLAQGRTEST